MSLQQINSDNLTQLEYFHDRLDFTQRYMELLKYNLAKFSHKTSKVRDSGDETAQGLLDFCVRDILLLKETSRLFNLNLKQFSYCLLAVEDHRDSNIEFINSKILNELNQFIETAKYSKAKEFRNLLGKYNKDQPKKKSFSNLLNALSGNKFDKSAINRVERSVCFDEMALDKSKSLNEEITQEIENFENKKIASLQIILKRYTLSQINFHNQALQLYTTAYKCLNNQDLTHSVKTDISKINGCHLNSVKIDDINNLEQLIGDLNKEVNHKPLIFKRNEIIPVRRDCTRQFLGRDSTISNSSLSLLRASLATDSLLAVAPVSERFVTNKFGGVKKSSSVTAKLSIQSIKSVNSDRIDEDCENSMKSTPNLEINNSTSIKNSSFQRETIRKDSGLIWFNETRL